MAHRKFKKPKFKRAYSKIKTKFKIAQIIELKLGPVILMKGN